MRSNIIVGTDSIFFGEKDNSFSSSFAYSYPDFKYDGEHYLDHNSGPNWHDGNKHVQPL